MSNFLIFNKSPNLSELPFLILIIYLDYDNADGLVSTICCHLGDVPVAWKEDEEFARIAVEETGLMIVSLVHMLKMNLREKIKND